MTINERTGRKFVSPPSSIKPDKIKLFATLRHDIRNPMHVVSGLAEVLALSEPSAARQKDIAITLKANADRLILLMENMFAFVQTLIDDPDASAPHGIRENSEGYKTEGIDKEKEGGRRCVLLVEDHQPNMMVATSYLDQLGYDYDVAATGIDALEKFSHAHYDAIILDIQMPEMNGFEVARCMRTMEQDRSLSYTPIIATTGYATDDDRFLCLKAGMDDFLSKPFKLKDLKGKLQNFWPVHALA